VLVELAEAAQAVAAAAVRAPAAVAVAAGAGCISMQMRSVTTALAAIAGVLTFKELLDVLVSVP